MTNDQLESRTDLMAERDRARDVAVALEQENARLVGALHELRTCAIERALVADDYLRIIDLALRIIDLALAEVET